METNILNIEFPATIETERTTIRSPQPGDGPAFNASVLESLDGMRRWLGLYKESAPTVAESEAVMREHYAKFHLRQYMMMLCFLKATETLVVTSSLRPDWKVPSF